MRLVGIDEGAFAAHFEGPSAREALQADLRFKESLGIWRLPAFFVQCGESAVLLAGVPRARDMAAAVERVLADGWPDL